MSTHSISASAGDVDIKMSFEQTHEISALQFDGDTTLKKFCLSYRSAGGSYIEYKDELTSHNTVNAFYYLTLLFFNDDF